jgi:DNA-binding MarR family transcriptional regulator
MVTTSTEASTPKPAIAVMQQIRILRRDLQQYSAAVERRFGASGAQVDFLLELHAHPLSRLSDLQMRIGIHQATASNMVAQLLKRGLIEKIPNPSDKRIVVLKLSAEGMDFVEAKNGLLLLRNQWEGYFSEMKPEKLALLNQSLGELAAVVTRVTAFCEKMDADEPDVDRAPPSKPSGPSI